MANRLVRYLLEGNGEVPVFIEDGGYFVDYSTDEMIGKSVDETKRHLPTTVFKPTRAELKTRISTLGYNKKITGETMTDAELDTFIQDFLDDLGLGDLA